MSNPTTTQHHDQYADDITIRTTNRQNNVAYHSHEAPSTQTKPTMGISDSGATGHFLQANAPVTNKRIARNPIVITLPDGNTIKSSHTCNLNIPWLPDKVTAAHIVPKLSHTSLLATRQFCDNGCEVTFTKQACKVTIAGNTVLEGPRDPKTKLWHLTSILRITDPTRG